MLIAATFAGCTDPPAAPPDYGPIVWSDSYDNATADRQVFSVALERSGAMEYDLFVRNGDMKITIMPESKKEHYLNGEDVRTIAENKGGHPVGEVPLAAGAYLVGVHCTRWWGASCPYNLELAVHEKQGAAKAA